MFHHSSLLQYFLKKTQSTSFHYNFFCPVMCFSKNNNLRKNTWERSRNKTFARMPVSRFFVWLKFWSSKKKQLGNRFPKFCSNPRGAYGFSQRKDPYTQRPARNEELGFSRNWNFWVPRPGPGISQKKAMDKLSSFIKDPLPGCPGVHHKDRMLHWLHGKNRAPKDWKVYKVKSLGDGFGFLLFFRVVSGDYGKPWYPKQPYLGGGNSTIFLIFTPDPWWKMIQFDEHIFQRGWFNHHRFVIFMGLLIGWWTKPWVSWFFQQTDLGLTGCFSGSLP